MLSGFAHAGICVPDVDAAVRWYCDVLGLTLLSAPYEMSGVAIERDMGELVPPPVVLKAAIVGFGRDDHVLELIEYPRARRSAPVRTSVVDVGLSHVGLVCDDIEATRAELSGRGVEFLTTATADVAGLRTTWCADPWGTVIILLEKTSDTLPYWRQYEA